MASALTTTKSKIRSLAAGRSFLSLLRSATSRCSSREHPTHGPDPRWSGPFLCVAMAGAGYLGNVCRADYAFMASRTLSVSTGFDANPTGWWHILRCPASLVTMNLVQGPFVNSAAGRAARWILKQVQDDEGGECLPSLSLRPQRLCVNPFCTQRR